MQTLITKSTSGYINIDNVYFRAKKITQDKEGHYIMMKGLISQKDITILTMYT